MIYEMVWVYKTLFNAFTMPGVLCARSNKRKNDRNMSFNRRDDVYMSSNRKYKVDMSTKKKQDQSINFKSMYDVDMAFNSNYNISIYFERMYEKSLSSKTIFYQEYEMCRITTARPIRSKPCKVYYVLNKAEDLQVT